MRAERPTGGCRSAPGKRWLTVCQNCCCTGSYVAAVGADPPLRRAFRKHSDRSPCVMDRAPGTFRGGVAPDVPRVAAAGKRGGPARAATEYVVPRCEHVFVRIAACRSGGKTAEHGDPPARFLPSTPADPRRDEYCARPNRVAGYARSSNETGGMIEPVASRSGTPEHRLGRDAASSFFSGPTRFDRAVGKSDEIVGAHRNTDSSIGRLPVQRIRLGTAGRRHQKSDIDNSRTSGESCPTQ